MNEAVNSPMSKVFYRSFMMQWTIIFFAPSEPREKRIKDPLCSLYCGIDYCTSGVSLMLASL